LHGVTAPTGPGPSHCPDLTITLRHTTIGRNPLEERSAGPRNLCLSTHNTHKRQTSIHSGGFETTLSASKRLQTHVT